MQTCKNFVNKKLLYHLQVAMTSIPVRKGTTVNRRSGVLKEKNEKGSNPDAGKRKHTSKESKHNPRPLLCQSIKKELEEENNKLHGELQNYGKKLRDLESTLFNTQEQLDKSREESAKVRDNCERTLLSCNIDPVTLEKIGASSEDENILSQRRKNARVHASALKDKLQTLNTQASSCIKTLNDISSELDNLDSITAQDTAKHSGEPAVTS